MSEARETPAPGHVDELSAWQAAAAEGIDMSLIEVNLSQSPAERIRRNNAVVKFTYKLRASVEQRNAHTGSGTAH